MIYLCRQTSLRPGGSDQLDALSIELFPRPSNNQTAGVQIRSDRFTSQPSGSDLNGSHSIDRDSVTETEWHRQRGSVTDIDTNTSVEESKRNNQSNKESARKTELETARGR